jgi:hypothetical protein
MKNTIPGMAAGCVAIYAGWYLLAAGCSSSKNAPTDTADSSDGVSNTGSSNGASNTASSSGGGGAGDAPPCNSPTCNIQGCPDPTQCFDGVFCCLRQYASVGFQGDCETLSDCADGGVLVQCQHQSDCGQAICCATPADSGLSGSACLNLGVGDSCAKHGDQEACGGGAPDECVTLGGAAANNCGPAVGHSLFGICMPLDGGQ